MLYHQATMLRVGLIGAGAMGSNHARVISQSERAHLEMVFDTSNAASARAAATWKTRIAENLDELSTCDAVVIASPTTTHYSIGLSLIGRGIPVLIEKPLASTLRETEEMLRLSALNNSVICCGFVERFNPALKTALGLLDGPIRHLITQRHSPYNPRAVLSVVLDLLIHDLDLTARVAPSDPSSVGASLWAPPGGGFEEIADCTLQFGNEMIASHSASRWGQRKIREVRLQTDMQLMEVDLVRMTVTGYRHRANSHDSHDIPVLLRSETLIEVPFIRHSGEPLALQFEYFVDLVSGFADHQAERESVKAAHILAEQVISANPGRVSLDSSGNSLTTNEQNSSD